VIGSDSTGFCSDTAFVNTVMNNNPNLTVTSNGPLNFCSGDNVILSAAPGQSYLWNTGATSQSIVSSQAGSYYAVVTTAAGCSDTTATFATSLFADPDTSSSASGPLSFCDGGSVSINAATGLNYLWNTGDTSQSISTSQSGTYYAIVTTNDGCSDTTRTYTTILFASPDTSVSASGSLNFCEGDSVTLTAASGHNYLWNTGANTQSIITSLSGPYYAQLTTTNGCIDTTETLEVVTYPILNTQISGVQTTVNNSVEAYSTPQSFNSTYTWNVSGGAITGGQGTNTIVVLWASGPTGIIDVVEFNGFCPLKSDTLTVSISGVGLDDNNLNSIILSPNPNSGLFSIKVYQEHIGSSYQILDNLGRLIDKGIIRDLSQDFDLSDKPKGVYRIQVSNDKAIKTLNVVIQ
jgi:hypothetical protein